MSIKKKRAKITGTIHFYGEEQLCDETFFAPENDTSGVIPMTIMIPLRQKRFFAFCVSYSKQTTIGEIIKQIVAFFDLEEKWFLNENNIYFRYKRDRFNVTNPKQSFTFLKDKYLDPDKTDQLSVDIMICVDAGCVDEYGSLRFYFHSRERGKHNEPHVHVSTLSGEYEATISIITGKLLAGEMPGKLLKSARKRIKDKQRDFLTWWNTKTDGLEVDINHSLGLIAY